jgi:CubicO group peptidase (beta-lactamase class C family)
MCTEEAMGAARIIQVLMLLAATAVSADPLPRAQPQSVGFSPERLERLTQTLKADVERGRIPGAVVAIARKGKLIYFEAIGYRDRASGEAMTTDTIFSIVSLTKPMTSVGLLTLYEEARVLLHEPVERYLPPIGQMRVGHVKAGPGGETTIETVAPSRPMAIHDLMRQTSGIPYGARGVSPIVEMYPRTSASVSVTMTGEEFIAKLATLPLLHHPGSV